MASPCIEDIIKAAEGKISARDAGRILRELSHRTKAMAAKEKIPLDEAAKKVTEEVAIEEELKAYVAKRAKLFAIRAKMRMLAAARSGRGKDFADSLIEYMTEVANAAHAKGHAFADRFFAILEQEGVLNDFKKGGPELSKDVFTERWQLTSGLPFATTNKTAQVVAKAVREIEVEYLAGARKHGAWSQDAPGYTGPQTHNSELLRRAGFASGKWHGKENQDLSYEVWRKSFSDKNGGTINVDWGRTLPGSDEAEQEAFLKSFHQSVYSGIHGTTSDIVDPSKHLGVGSLAERISSERLLWFSDPESQWNYNQRWGNNDFNQSIINELFSFGRNISMLQYLGPSSEATYQNVIKILRDDAKSLINAQEIGRKLNRRQMQGAYDIVSGRANTSVNTFLSKIVDSIKATVVASKGGGILFSMLGDRVFIDSSLARQGASALHRMNVQIGKLAVNTPEGKRQLRSLGFLVNSMASQMHERWATDVRPYFNLDKAVSWSFKLQGVEYVGNKHRMIAMSAASEHLGAMASKSFDELPVEMQVHLNGYQFSRAEWDAVRSTAFDIDGDEMTWTVIAPDRMQDLPDDVIDKMLEAEGITVSQPNRSRKRDLLESKMQAYFNDIATEMVPTPGLREKLKMTGGGLLKGTIIRSALDLFFTFKGFGMTVAMRNARSYGRLWAAGQYKAVGWQVATMVAEAAALGYVGWAIREAFKGRTPPLITDENGELDATQFMSVFMESLKRGGGLGIYGDYLLTSYNRDNKTFLEAVAGPVLSELDPLAALGTSTFKTAFGDQEPASFALQSLRFAEANAPFINLFYSKLVLDHFFLWNLKEGLSPGLFRKSERAIGDQWRQEYFIEPVMD